MMKKPSKTLPSMWTFFKPFPVHLWLGIIAALAATSLVMFLIHNIGHFCKKLKEKIKPNAGKAKNVRDYHFQAPEIQDDMDHAEPVTLQLQAGTPSSEFSILNSMWFMVASFMQQGSSMEPRYYCISYTTLS